MGGTEFLGNFFGMEGGFNFSGMVGTTIAIILGLIGLGIAGLFLWWILVKKTNWNLKVIIFVPRSQGNFMNVKFAKGCYSTKRGAVLIKRSMKKPVPMAPFNIKDCLLGENKLFVIQVGAEKYVPVINDSYMELFDDETNEQAAKIKAIVEDLESKSWKNSFERDSKTAYTIINLLKDYAPYISIGLVIFLWGLQFVILYMKVA